MNKFHQIRKALRLDLVTAAGKAGIDEMQLALFEHGMGWIAIGTAYRLAAILEVPVGQVFPLLRDVFAKAELLDDEAERLELVFKPENREILAQSGIDPDRMAWYAIFQLKSGNERRYFLTSTEYRRMRQEMLHSETSDGFLTFHSDCQNVILRKAAIASVRFTNDASYAWFRSTERDFVITVVSNVSPRPVKMEVPPDGRPDGNGPRPFAELLAAARGEHPVVPPDSPETARPQPDMPAFFSLLDDPDETIVSFDGIEVIEIPCGVLMPDLYDEDEEYAEGHEGGESLKTMEMLGEA
ncbi:helix-turn-helix transcriptional regulator [Agrobacterium rubi]|nr:helix-turn-helix transcriptional regulator [Agrobacterium rubi]NTF24545.1 helix-turn-helix transcriptional regulator [Agrobacterium rubi]